MSMSPPVPNSLCRTHALVALVAGITNGETLSITIMRESQSVRRGLPPEAEPLRRRFRLFPYVGGVGSCWASGCSGRGQRVALTKRASRPFRASDP